MSYIYQIVTASDMVQAFQAMGRGLQFSYSGLQALHEYLEQLAEDTGEPIELDVIALCVEFSEYGSAAEAAKCFDFEPVEDDEPEVIEEEALNWLLHRTTVIEFGGGVIIQDF